MAESDFSLSRDLLHELFEYRDGKLFWKKTNTTRTDIVGKEVGCLNSRGYKVTSIHQTQYLVHRLIYAMFHSALPDVIDHIDGNPANNKIENLRASSASENLYNTKKYKNNTTGVKGVNFNQQLKKYSARCQVNKKQNWLGLFPSVELAEQAVKAFRAKHHGEFANHG